MSAISNMIADSVPDDASGTREIGFAVPARYNASRILFDNIAAKRGDRLAVIGPSGQRTYAELCADASRWGQGLRNIGLQRSDRILMFLDDTPSYPAAFFGAVRAGLVPLLINTLTPPDLLQFYLADSGATAAVVERNSGRFSQVMLRHAIADVDHCEWIAAAECRPRCSHRRIVAADLFRSS
jgi:acetyl-CoA synthetase